MFNIFAKEGKT